MASNYKSYADAGMAALMNWYNSSSGLWDNIGWWNCANALEVVIDYSLRTNTTAYYSVVANTFQKNKDFSPFRFINVNANFLNDHYDDEGWWALAWIKAYDLTGIVDYLNMAETIFTDMQGGWDPTTCGGGTWWDKARTYKNAITNELFLTIAARLYQRTSKDTYLTLANGAASWLTNAGRQGGLINSQNLINDGLTGSCQNNGGSVWTYNQGVILSGLADLYKVTHNSTLLAQAHKIADAAIATLINSNGILTETACELNNTCNGDQCQFKGIFMRNLSYLYETDPTKTAYRDFIIKNADSIWLDNRNSSNQFGLKWAGPLDAPDAVKHSSALDAIITAMPFDTYTLNLSIGQNNDGRLEAFHIDSSLTVQRNWQTVPNGGWAGWGSPLGSAEQATSFAIGQNANGGLEVFAIGPDSYLYRTYQGQGGWIGWNQLPGGWQGKAIKMGRNTDGRQELFVIGLDNVIYHNWQTSPNIDSWSGWNLLGPSAQAAVSFAVGQNANGALEIFALGTDSRIYRNYQTNNWIGWSQISGNGLGKVLAVGRNSDGRQELFLVGLDNQVYHNWQTSPNVDSWSGWNLLGPGAQTASTFVLGQNANGSLEVFALDLNGYIHRNYQTNNWIGWSQFPGWQAQVISVGRNADGRQELFVVGRDNNLYHSWQTGPNADSWSGWIAL